MARLISTVPTLLALATLAALMSGLAPLQAQQDDATTEKRLREKVAKTRKLYDAELTRLKKKKMACKEEYGLLMSKSTKERLAGLMDSVRAKHLGTITGGPLAAKARNEITRDVRGALSSAVGEYISKLLAEPLRDEFLGRVKDDDYSSIKVVTDLVADAFTGDFEQDFETEMVRILSRKFETLKANLEKAKKELDDHLRTVKARESGLPFGMVRVEGGSFRIGVDKKDMQQFSKLVGTPLQELHLHFRSSPSHERELDPFLIDTREVTCEAYMRFLEDTGRKKYPKHWIDKKIPKDFAKRPVTYVSFLDAQAFCRWVGRRLPTEFEWEAAARYGRDKKLMKFYAWGDEAPNADKDKDRCNYDGSINDKRRPPYIKGLKNLPPVMPVGSCPTGVNQSLSLFDMCGNAAEITSSIFEPYDGFKNMKIGRRSVSTVDFNRFDIVVRGGHGLNSREIVTTFWRLGLNPSNSASCVGFRTAATPIKGKDHLDALLGEGDYDRYLVDFPLLDSDMLENRKRPALALDDPSRFTALMAGGWDAETGLPSRARFISIVNRKANDFRNVQTLSGYAGKNNEPVLIGFLHTDVAFEEPKLHPADYLVLWQPAHEEVIEPEEGAESEESEEKGKGKGKGKERKGPPPTRKVPDRVLFYDVKKSRSEMVAFDMTFYQPVDSRAQPTAIRQNSKDGDGVSLVYSFPIKYKKQKAFVVTIPLKASPGATSEYK